MIDLLIILILLLSIAVFTLFVTYIFEDERPQLFWIAGLILMILVCWGAIREFSRTQNYKIDKNIVMVDRVSPSPNSPTMIFNKKLKVEVIEFDMPMGEFKDYTNYRIYLDSVTYIDVNSSSFDSLDLKLGKKLYKR